MTKEESHLIAGIAMWFLIVILCLWLAGCSRQTPVSDINDSIQHDVSEMIDYAQNNMTIDNDNQLLINGARNCAARANDMAKTCEATIKAYKTEVASWKLVATLLMVIAVFLGVICIKK